MSGTTQIDQLPSTSSNPSENPVQNSLPQQPPTSDVNTENIKVENYGQQLNTEREQTGSQIPPIDYTSQLSSALKDAQAAGATVLPSKDIPLQTLSMQQDYQTKPDYVPTSDTNDYIGNILNKEKIILEQKQKQNQTDNLEYIYQSLQIPILIGIMYFLFQLPFIRKNLLTFLPNLFNKDGNPKLSGYIFNSLVFASLYTLLVKGLHYLQN
ncbi:hypothetical protein ceV_098 [Chrysochromulina ericina virus CeV-01B]|jgi:hypothetical protein|uniref:Uncharacterized protein n=1 Tax=Chrysochromulina ericina virus CeV-01B TaxID=3070830 RepID=A0A0N9QWX3_9VIRU|nr:hypothetical protein ceV_098 [Chrysochromulina ericina virus]ALH23004.1 hypothetical protein ceV_098 [Chrysochromulina ericina virus CeV-01B]|tara:strand:+ start:32663 stop:33295 length:633 start_codon:yes stop_codon:yes gene_type:complete